LTWNENKKKIQKKKIYASDCVSDEQIHFSAATWAELRLFVPLAMSLNDQLKSFRKSLASQPVYGVKRSNAGGTDNKNESQKSSTPGTPAIANNTRAAYESSMEGKKKNKRANQGVGMNIRLIE
jgi:hypothetical protein